MKAWLYCKVCDNGEYFMTFGGFSGVHVKRDHPGIDPFPLVRWRCRQPFCETSSDDEAWIAQHIDQDHPSAYACPRCDARFPTPKDAGKHVKQEHRCVICGALCEDAAKRQYHYEGQHGVKAIFRDDVAVPA